MKIFLTLTFVLIFNHARSQAPPWEWARTTIGSGVGSGWQESYSIASDQIGNAYLSGFFHDPSLSIGSFTLTNNGVNNILIAKYDSIGNVLWAKKSSGAGDNECNQVVVDNIGNAYLTGKFNSTFIAFDSDTLYCSSSGSNSFLVKYDSSGNEVWSKGGKGTGTNVGTSVSVDIFGNIYIAGYYNSPIIVFDTDTLINTAAGFTDIFIVKYDPSGNVIWAKSIGGIWAENCMSIITDNAGNLLITGGFSSPTLLIDTFSFSCVGGSDLFLAKLDSSGNIIWVKSQGGTGSDNSYSVTIDLRKNIYLTGMFTSPTIVFGPDTLYGTGSTDAFLTKYDSLGNVIWARSSVGIGGETGYCVISDDAGDIYLSGGFYDSLGISFGGLALPFPTNSFDPMFIIKFDSLGNGIWGKILPSGGDDQNSIALCTNGNIYVGGDFYNVNPFILDCDTLLRTSSENVFIAKLGHNLCPGIHESVSPTTQLNNLNLFPNPFNDKLNISVNENSCVQIILYDILSRNLLQEVFINSTVLNTEKLVSGIYFYEIQNKEGTLTKGKVIKQ